MNCKYCGEKGATKRWLRMCKRCYEVAKKIVPKR
jgi:hypothetical protein